MPLPQSLQNAIKRNHTKEIEKLFAQIKQTNDELAAKHGYVLVRHDDLLSMCFQFALDNQVSQNTTLLFTRYNEDVNTAFNRIGTAIRSGRSDVADVLARRDAGIISQRYQRLRENFRINLGHRSYEKERQIMSDLDLTVYPRLIQNASDGGNIKRVYTLVRLWLQCCTNLNQFASFINGIVRDGKKNPLNKRAWDNFIAGLSLLSKSHEYSLNSLPFTKIDLDALANYQHSSAPKQRTKQPTLYSVDSFTENWWGGTFTKVNVTLNDKFNHYDDGYDEPSLFDEIIPSLHALHDDVPDEFKCLITNHINNYPIVPRLAKKGDIDLLQMILKHYNANVNEACHDHSEEITGLEIAIEKQRYDIMFALLEHPLIVTDDALSHAARLGNIFAFEALVDRVNEPEAITRSLEAANKYCQIEFIEFALKKHAKYIKDKQTFFKSGLYRAAKSGDAKALKYYYQKLKPFAENNFEGFNKTCLTTLWVATTHGRTDCVAQLLKLEATLNCNNPNPQYSRYERPLIERPLIIMANPETTSILLDRPEIDLNPNQVIDNYSVLSSKLFQYAKLSEQSNQSYRCQMALDNVIKLLINPKLNPEQISRALLSVTLNDYPDMYSPDRFNAIDILNNVITAACAREDLSDAEHNKVLAIKHLSAALSLLFPYSDYEELYSYWRSMSTDAYDALEASVTADPSIYVSLNNTIAKDKTIHIRNTSRWDILADMTEKLTQRFPELKISIKPIDDHQHKPNKPESLKEALEKRKKRDRRPASVTQDGLFATIKEPIADEPIAKRTRRQLRQ